MKKYFLIFIFFICSVQCSEFETRKIGVIKNHHQDSIDRTVTWNPPERIQILNGVQMYLDKDLSEGNFVAYRNNKNIAVRTVVFLVTPEGFALLDRNTYSNFWCHNQTESVKQQRWSAIVDLDNAWKKRLKR